MISLKANSKSINGIKDNKNAMIQMLPTVAMAVVMLYAIMYIGTYINGTIGQQLIDGMPATASQRTVFENHSFSTINNLSDSFDDNTEIVSIAAIITVLTMPLMAVVAVKRLI